jgi:hypothetical protein
MIMGCLFRIPDPRPGSFHPGSWRIPDSGSASATLDRQTKQATTTIQVVKLQQKLLTDHQIAEN